jgi:hypothetical protein
MRLPSSARVLQRMAAMVAVANKGGIMEPLTKIELGSCTWLGLIAIACAVAGELLTLADNPEGKRFSFVERENTRRAADGQQARYR